MIRKRWEKIQAAGRTTASLLIGLTAVLLLIRAVELVQHNFYRDWKFEYFLSQIGLSPRATGEDALRILGSAERTDYEYGESGAGWEIIYITLQYDGFELAMTGDSLAEPICMIRAERPGILSLRARVDIGSGESEAVWAYRHEQGFGVGEMDGEIAFALGDDHAIAEWYACFLIFQIGEDGNVSKITVTDGW